MGDQKLADNQDSDGYEGMMNLPVILGQRQCRELRNHYGYSELKRLELTDLSFTHQTHADYDHRI